MYVFNLTFQGGNQLLLEIWTWTTIVCFGCHKNKYTYLIEKVFFFFSVWQKQDQATKDFMSEAQVYQTDPPPKLLDMFKKFNATHASAFGSAWEEQNVMTTQKSDSLF